MGKCVPGMPCFGREKDVIIYTTYPKGCETLYPSPYTLPLSSDNIYYSGPELPNLQVNTLEGLTEILQKIDNKIAELTALIET